MEEIHLKKAIIVILITFSSATYDFVVKPEFGEKPKDLNITAYVGQTSRLPCTVKHLSGKRVSWIRQRDLQVLSTGRHTFSTDLRISVLPGTRFKLRRPRDLEPYGHHGSHVSKGTSEENRLTEPSSSELSNLEFEDEGKDIGKDSIKFNGGEFMAGFPDYVEEDVRRSHQFTRDKKDTTHGRRNIHHYRYGRQKRNHWYKEAMQVVSLASPNGYYSLSNGKQKRSKKAIPLISSHKGYAQLQSLAALPSAGSQNKEQSETQLRESNPIAIYPQGPISIASDSKNLKLAPNYIDGVWEPEDYTLQIKFTKPQDAGTYICQINTEPRITQAVVLRVVKMRAEILSRRELFVKAGNPIKLSCRVNHGALSPGFILWYKGERLVEYENSGGRIQVQTEAGGVSHLILRNAHPEDSSNYTCSPAGGEPASLILNVIVDERQAAMQQGNHCPSITSPTPTIILCTTVLIGHLLSRPAEQILSVMSYVIPGALLGLGQAFISFQMKLATCSILLILFMLVIVDESNEISCGENILDKIPNDSFFFFFRDHKNIDSWSRIPNRLLLVMSRILQAMNGILESLPGQLPGNNLAMVVVASFVVWMWSFMFLARHTFISSQMSFK